MKSNPLFPVKPLNPLRHSAETLLMANPDFIATINPQDLCKLLNELNIYKLELEMQNLELRNTQHELEILRDKYFTLYEFSPVAHFILAADAMIIDVNLAGAAILGLEKSYLLKSGFSRFIASDYQHSFYLHRQHMLATQSKQTIELKFIKKNGSCFFAHVESILLDRNIHPAQQFLISLVDINAQKQTRDEIEDRVAKRTQELQQKNQKLEHDIRIQKLKNTSD